MSRSSFTDLTRRRRPIRRTPPASRPLLEVLEDRCLLSFSPAVNYPVGTSPQAVVTADFNHDGRLDLATANYDGSVSVLLGKADGTFQPALTSATGYGPVSVAVGDFNADGKLDLATANSGGYDVSVLLGNGDGTFQAPSSLGVTGNPQSVAVGDFNGDGKMDLGVTSNLSVFDGCGDYGCYYHNEGYANVLLGNGDGSFSGPNSTFLDYAYYDSAVAADLNGDAFDDFVTVSAYGYVNVLRGDSSGYLQGPSFFYTGYPSFSVAAGDLNADGHTDLVTANYYGNTVSVLLGDGSGSFSAAGNYATGGNAAAVVLGDFTGDGKVDVATANSDSDSLSVLYGNGNGTFSSAVNSAVGSRPFGVAAGDFNGDGRLDAATANSSSGDVSVLINDRSWPPPPPPSVTISDVTVTEGNTGSTSATFTLTLSSAYGTPITVHYATADGSATAGSDYTAASGDVTFAAGETSKAIPVAVIGDRLGESNETFVVNLTSTDAPVADGQGVGTILDDEPLVFINDVTVTEGNTGSVSATFTLSLPFAYDAAVTVHYATANGSATAGSDYTAASGDVTFAAGQTTRPLTVAVLGDRLAEPTETFVVNLTSSGASIGDGQGVGTILDNEPRISINNVSMKEGNGNGNNTTLFVFTVTLSAAYDQAVTFSYATADGTATTVDHDYQAKSGTLTFAPGQTSLTITIAVYRDNKVESNETFFVNLSGASSNALFTNWQGIGTILDDDRKK